MSGEASAGVGILQAAAAVSVRLESRFPNLGPNQATKNPTCSGMDQGRNAAEKSDYVCVEEATQPYQTNHNER